MPHFEEQSTLYHLSPAKEVPYQLFENDPFIRIYYISLSPPEKVLVLP